LHEKLFKAKRFIELIIYIAFVLIEESEHALVAIYKVLNDLQNVLRIVCMP